MLARTPLESTELFAGLKERPVIGQSIVMYEPVYNHDLIHGIPLLVQNHPFIPATITLENFMADAIFPASSKESENVKSFFFCYKRHKIRNHQTRRILPPRLL